MYDELIRKLRELASIPAHCENVDSCDGCSKEDICLRFTNERIIETASEAADAIESTSKAYQMMAEAYEAEVTKPKWIPVTERLPKAERKSYWVCTDTGYQCECRWTNDRFGIRESDEWGWKIFDIPQYQKVVAWMPLPKPYEPPKEET